VSSQRSRTQVDVDPREARDRHHGPALAFRLQVDQPQDGHGCASRRRPVGAAEDCIVVELIGNVRFHLKPDIVALLGY
jgi:hypothetical protein